MYLPVLQLLHAETVPPEKVPARQTLQEALPTMLFALPGGQAVHEEAVPVDAEK